MSPDIPAMADRLFNTAPSGVNVIKKKIKIFMKFPLKFRVRFNGVLFHTIMSHINFLF